MKTYSFTIELLGAVPPTPDLSERLHEAGCGDAAVSWSGGVLKVAFSREAESLADAIYSAQCQVDAVVKAYSTRITADYDQ